MRRSGCTAFAPRSRQVGVKISLTSSVVMLLPWTILTGMTRLSMSKLDGLRFFGVEVGDELAMKINY